VSQKIASTGGLHLVREFWGGYVAFLRDRDTDAQYVIRDASGKSPCYYTRTCNVTLVFADIADLAPLELPPFSVNWEYLAAFIVAG
jgi:asparagine synthase (glutamine-hydrolysing)